MTRVRGVRGTSGLDVYDYGIRSGFVSVLEETHQDGVPRLKMQGEIGGWGGGREGGREREIPLTVTAAQITQTSLWPKQINMSQTQKSYFQSQKYTEIILARNSQREKKAPCEK